MFEIGSCVLYGAQGVCRIEARREEAFSGSAREYYILAPLDDPKMVIYVPTDSGPLLAQMRPLLTPEELSVLLRRGKERETELEWVNDPRSRSEQFKAILQSGNRTQLLAMLQLIHQRREQLVAAGRKLYASDEMACQKGEKLLHGEIAAVLHIHPDQVQEYLRAQLGKEG